MPTYHSSLTAARAGAALPKWAPKVSSVIAAAAPELIDRAKPGSVQLLSSVTVLKSENGSKCIQLNAARIVCNISMTMICLQPTVFSAGALIKLCFPVEPAREEFSNQQVHGAWISYHGLETEVLAGSTAVVEAVASLCNGS